jgi:hypothetical protein
VFGLRIRAVTTATLAAAAAIGCGHSDAFLTPDDRRPDPLTAIVPIRITFDAGADIHPLWSADGSRLLYTFERFLPLADYPDRCLGALAPSGGQRMHEWCWPSWDEGTRRDGIEWGALDGEGRLVFVHHTSAGDKQPLPFHGWAYLGDTAAIVNPRPLVELMIPYDGATFPYDYLTGPVFTGPDEVTALAASIAVTQACGSCPFDTTFTGADLVRLSLGGTASLRALARLQGAAFLSWDRSADRFFFGRAGKVETVPTEGGEASLVWQVPRSPDRRDVLLTGVAAGRGRVAVSWRWFQHDTLHSSLALLTPEGSPETLRHEIGGVQWGELSLSPDGRSLVAERRDGADRDLYLFRLPE